MLVNLDDVLVDLDDKPMEVPDGVDRDGNPNVVPLTLGRLIEQVLNSSVADAVRRFDVMITLHKKHEVELDQKERTFILACADGVLFPLAHGRLNQLLADPPDPPKDNTSKGKAKS